VSEWSDRVGIEGALCFFGTGGVATAADDDAAAVNNGGLFDEEEQDELEGEIQESSSSGEMVQGGASGISTTGGERVRRMLARRGGRGSGGRWVISDLEVHRILERMDVSSHREHAADRGSTTRRIQENASTSPSPIYLTSILFLELDNSPNLNILNTDTTYLTTNLPADSIVSYSSISTKLDPSKSLQDQLEYVVGGVMVVMFGVDEEGSVVQNTVAWGYNVEKCGDGGVVEKGDVIGWIEIDDYNPAQEVFCTAMPLPPPTTTLSPTTPPPTTPSPTSSSSKSASKSGKVANGAFTKSAKPHVIFSKSSKATTTVVGSSKAYKVMGVGKTGKSEDDMPISGGVEVGSKSGKATAVFKSKND